MRLRLSAVVLAAASLLSASVRAESADVAKWLVVSDIHFDPFADPKLVDSLAAIAPEKWAGVLAGGDRSRDVKFGSDSDYSLYRRTLVAMHDAQPTPPVVLVAGDLLVHEFKDHFEHTATKHDAEAFESFLEKAITFVTSQLRVTFPNAQIVITLGNNDGDCGDYGVTANSPFLAYYAKAMKPLADPANKAPDFEKTMAAGGYAMVPAADSSIRLVVMNSVFLSRKFKDSCGVPGGHPGEDEMQWLTSTLASAGGPVWILTHIPPGIDARASSEGKVISFYGEQFVQPIVALLTEPGSNIKLLAAGHTHGASFRLTHPGVGAIPMLLVPSVSPIFKNNPAFEVASVSRSKGDLLDVELHALLGDKWGTTFTLSAETNIRSNAAQAFAKFESRIATDPVARQHFESAYVGDAKFQAVDESNWRIYWCAIGNLEPDGFASCMSVEK